MNSRASWRCVLALPLLLVFVTSARADPWLAPDDPGLRSDLQLLADEGLVTTPMTSWPLSWADVVRDLERLRSVDLRTASISEAYDRVRREARSNTRVRVLNPHAELAVAADPILVRGFEDTPREELEFGGGFDWIGDRFAARLQVRRVLDPDDGKDTRLDGSYLGVAIGNLMISAGYMEKWWGPGWAGSLILSNNARPVPSITIERNFSRPFDVPVLKWLGPWRASFQAGQLESQRDDFPRAHFIALRVAFKPTPSLEIGLSRSAQLCGRGRDCGLDTYWDMIIGNDNDQSLKDQPGNQLAGFDARWSAAQSLRVPVAVYGQAIGEDEAGSLPSRYLGLAGAEAWGRVGHWTVRGYGEYAHTSCNFSRAEPIRGCAYENTVYTDGYRFRDRAIGHAYDRDGEGWTVGAIAQKDRWQVTARAYDVRLNEGQAGERHTVAPQGGRLKGIQAAFATQSREWGRVRVGIGYDDATGSNLGVPGGAKAFVEWRREV